ncbi:hemin uptake protein HemP [Salmonella bongori]|uniref:hemin uptake protein HemP n=1 Tax=Salmonella bongori TaxID=54736 RepID=UPI0015C47E5D|nr:hemin uptake protein HemP [Salmonella bongori]EHU5138097.1 hemin uptake protein HemP [Salmonella bongori]EIL5514951.1 hemin uptake protein HemP [Salmonella bongori]EIZ4350436.1 hemin uptake protein HemP [Salmonella bongori serovar 48:z81:-]EJX9719951.1 hemin uptake protein HemP [Salmonella bongori]EJX9724913.1 hemin uptake protein HemP [Salmonella bongori]
MIIIIVIIFITDRPDMHNTTAAAKNVNAPRSPARTKRQFDSRTLLGDEGWALIEHNGQLYLLRQTQSGKLILTK